MKLIETPPSGHRLASTLVRCALNVFLLLPIASNSETFEPRGLRATAPSVDANGSPEFQYVIPVPPGRGKSPDILVSYSGGDDGVLGFAWRLNVGRSIHRCVGSKLTDGRTVPIRYQTEDRLCLNGQRLIQVNGSQVPQIGSNTRDSAGVGPNDYREYRLQHEPIVRIRAYGGGAASPVGPISFRVWNKDGSVDSFGPEPGLDADFGLERHTLPAMGGLILRWHLTKSVDKNGAVQKFFYDSYSGPSGMEGAPARQVAIREIQYGPDIKLRFNYLNRDSATTGESSVGVTLGHWSGNHVLVSEIISYIGARSSLPGDLTGGVAVSSTRFSYEKSESARPLLKTLKSCAGGSDSNRCVQVAEFGYTKLNTTNFLTQPVAGLPKASHKFSTWGTSEGVEYSRVWAVDVNNDGRTDIIRSWITVNPSCAGVVGCIGLRHSAVYFSNGDGSFSEDNFGLNPPLGDEPLFADFDGDGRTDILDGNVFHAGTDKPLTLHRNTVAGFVSAPIVGVTPAHQHLRNESPPGDEGYPVLGTIWNEANQFFVLDFDGDGKLDILTTRVPENKIYQTRIDPQSLCATQRCTRAFKGNGLGQFSEVSTNLQNRTLIMPGRPPIGGFAISDINADGYSDLILSDPEKWPFGFHGYFISELSGNFTFVEVPSTQLQSLAEAGSRALRMTNSGERQFIHANPKSYGQVMVSTLMSHTGGGIYIKSLSTNPGSWPAEANEWELLSTADFDGDGRSDFLFGHYKMEYDQAGEPKPFTKQYSMTTLHLTRSLFGLSSFNFSVPSSLLGSGEDHLQKQKTLFGSFTGAGLEFLTIGDESVGGPPATLFRRDKAIPSDRLLTVSLGMEGKYTFNYESAVVSGRVKSDGSSVTDAVSVAPGGFIVTSLSKPTPQPNSTLVSEYQYSGERVSNRGLGYLGFSEVREQNVGADGQPLTRITRYSQSEPYVGKKTSEALHFAQLTSTTTTNQLQFSRYITCDAKSSTTAVDLAINTGENCPAFGHGEPSGPDSAFVWKQTYTPFVRNTMKDLSGAPLYTQSVRTSVNAAGNPINIVDTKQSTSNSYVITTAYTYQPDDTTCSSNTECRQWVGRIATRTESRTAPSTIPEVSSGVASKVVVGQPTAIPLGSTELQFMAVMLLLED